MNALTATLTYVTQIAITKALQQGVQGDQSRHAKTTLAVWDTLASNTVILIVEAANLVEVFWPAFVSIINPTSATYQGPIVVCVQLIYLLLVSNILTILGLWLKYRNSNSRFGFSFSDHERYPEILGYLCIQVVLRITILSWPTALVSIFLIWSATLVAVVREEYSLVKRYQEDYVKFWNSSPSNVPMLDSIGEIIFRLKGYNSNIYRPKGTLSKAWPAIYYC